MMEKDYLDIIKEKEFIALNAIEREEIAEVCATEEEFNAMKAMMLQIDTVSEPITPNPKTKKSLDSLFAQSYPKAAPVWYNNVFAVIIPKEKPIYRQPLAQIAAAFLIFWMVFPFFNDSLVKENKQVAKVELKEKIQPAEGVVDTSMDDEVLTENNVETVAEVIKEKVVTTNYQSVRTRAVEEDIPTATLFDAEMSDADLREDESIELEESIHPDGIFIGAKNQNVAFAQPVSESQDLLDLLTPTF